MRTLALDACPTCGATERDDLEIGDHRLQRCARCDSVYAPEYADPAEVYVDGYLLGRTPFGIDVSHPTFQEYLAAAGARRAALIERITGASASLVDVGCGTGEFAAAAMKHGFDVVGVEPESSGAEITRSRGVDVRNATLEDAGLPEGGFDVVTAFHVLEHLPDSRAFLASLGRFAKPGGHVVVEVPNFRSVLRRRSKAAWIHLRPLEHLLHHSPETLERSFRLAGLEPVTLRTPTWIGRPQSVVQALSDLGLPGPSPIRAALGRRAGGDGLERVPTRAGWVLLGAVEALYDRFGVGMVVFGVARVPGGSPGSRLRARRP